MAADVDEPTLAEVERRIGQMYPLAKQVDNALQGAVFPLGRDQLVWVARENEAPPTLISLLSALLDREYHSLDEVQVAIDQGMGQRTPDR